MVKLFLLLGVLNLATLLSCDHHIDTGYSSKPFPWKQVRLPKHVVPVHYDLLIHPNLTTLTFMGFAKIEIVVHQQTSSIILHSKYLHIAKATIQGEMGGIHAERGVSVSEYPPFEQIALLTDEPLLPGKNYSIVIQYSANLSDSFHGFYKSTYRTPEGEVR